ncbi:MAG: DUF5662 family protein [bacterium]|nr:DUF5662 family protein [bacterium]
MIYLRYLRTVLRHKWFVFLECLKAGIPITGLTHDLSKLLPDEFLPYARYWGKDPEVRTDAEISAFIKAKEKHDKRNHHHWEKWIPRGGSENPEPRPMSQKSRLEMLCDWRAAGLAYKGIDDSADFYLSNKDRIKLHPKTREWIEMRLGINNDSQKETCL